MFTITEKSALLYEKVTIFDRPLTTWALLSNANFLSINNARSNLKRCVRHFFFNYSSLDVGKVNKYPLTACIYLFRSSA